MVQKIQTQKNPRWQLKTLIGEYEDRNPGERLSYQRIKQETGLSKTLLSRIGTNDATRADLETIRVLVVYFSEKLERNLTTNDILKFER